jgi:hypothetical protein
MFLHKEINRKSKALWCMPFCVIRLERYFLLNCCHELHIMPINVCINQEKTWNKQAFKNTVWMKNIFNQHSPCLFIEILRHETWGLIHVKEIPLDDEAFDSCFRNNDYFHIRGLNTYSCKLFSYKLRKLFTIVI